MIEVEWGSSFLTVSRENWITRFCQSYRKRLAPSFRKGNGGRWSWVSVSSQSLLLFPLRARGVSLCVLILSHPLPPIHTHTCTHRPRPRPRPPPLLPPRLPRLPRLLIAFSESTHLRKTWSKYFLGLTCDIQIFLAYVSSSPSSLIFHHHCE